MLYSSLLLGFGRTQDDVDALLLGVADESAGVYHHRLGVGAVAVVNDFVSGCGELCRNVFGVDAVFGAPECYDIDFFHYPKLEKPERLPSPPFAV